MKRSTCRPRTGAVRTPLTLAAFALLLSLAAPFATAQDSGFLSESLSLEQRLMREDLSEYEQATAAESRARTELDDVMSQVAALATEAATGEAAANNLRRAELRAAEAAALWRDASARTAGVVARLEGRLQRLRMLSNLLVSGATATVRPDVSGVWRVTVFPEQVQGVFDLRQSGTVLTGTYRLEDGRRGSLQGNLVSDRVRLDLLDAQRGFSAIYYGDVGADERAIAGQWAPAELGDGGSGGGAWQAVLTSEGAQ